MTTVMANALNSWGNVTLTVFSSAIIIKEQMCLKVIMTILVSFIIRANCQTF